MPVARISESPLSTTPGPVDIYYREVGDGQPLIFLHGGWGYQIYPFETQIADLGKSYRIIIPDRTGYGRSRRINQLLPDFHSRAASETFSLIKALNLERPILWGHSDGAVIAAMMAITKPSELRGVILEAIHFYRVKPASRGYFETMVSHPETLGDRVKMVLANDHGDDYWWDLIRLNGRAWLNIADQSQSPEQDLYSGRLAELSIPTLIIHGANDPRTEPGELDAVRAALPSATFKLIEDGGHSPHSHPRAGGDCTAAAREFLASVS